MNSPADNPFASPQTADVAVPCEDVTTFFGICRRGFQLSRRYKFFIQPGELLAGRVAGGTFDRLVTWGLRFATAVAVSVAGVLLTFVVSSYWEDAGATFALLFMLFAIGVIVWFEFRYIRRSRDVQRTTRYDLAPLTLEAFRRIHRQSFAIRSGDTISIKAWSRRSSPLHGWRLQGELEFRLKPQPGLAGRVKIIVAGRMAEQIVAELREAGFPAANAR